MVHVDLHVHVCLHIYTCVPYAARAQRAEPRSFQVLRVLLETPRIELPSRLQFKVGSCRAAACRRLPATARASNPTRAMAPDAPPSACDTDFSGMGIYVDGRVKNELDELLSAKPAAELTARDVHPIAPMHYLDDQPMLRAAEFFGLTAKEDANVGGASKPSADATASPNATAVSATGVKTILDFGAGFAGDARCLASEYADARVTCVEVQRHIHDAGQTFTRLLGLGNVCVHECVDVFDGASGDTNRGDADANVATFARVPGAPYGATRVGSSRRAAIILLGRPLGCPTTLTLCCGVCSRATVTGSPSVVGQPLP